MSDRQVEASFYSMTNIAEQRTSPITYDRTVSEKMFDEIQLINHSMIHDEQYDDEERQQSISNADIDEHVFKHSEFGRTSPLLYTSNELIRPRAISTAADHYPINHDTTPEHIRRENNNRVTYRQDVAIRYLQPPTPIPSGPLIIREIRAAPLPDAPPLIINQRPPIPMTPPPVIIRERPPVPPPIEPARIVNRYLPVSPAPPRQVIVERQAPFPEKPPPIIIEKWLPYRTVSERRVIVQHAEPLAPKPIKRNMIITWDAPQVNLVNNVRELGIVRTDPHMYTVQYGSQLASTDYVMSTMAKFGLGNNYAQMIDSSIERCAPSIVRDEENSLSSYRSTSDKPYHHIDAYRNARLSVNNDDEKFQLSTHSSNEQATLWATSLNG
jgi:hypothetical protein